GFVAICPEAYPYNTVPEPTTIGYKRADWWLAAAAKMHQDHPNWTGVGKLVWDGRRAIDLLFELPDIDTQRVAMMGHSLGGKISFYTAALDDRIKATIVSDFGIGWGFTNWN